MVESRRGREAEELAEDARQLLMELDRSVPGAAMATGECRPALDVVDTAAGVEVLMDIPGVPVSAIRVWVRQNTVLVVGAKLGATAPPDARYHVAERSSGRFARGVRLSTAVDTGAARAFVSAGQLRVVLPRLVERRGQLIQIPIETP